MAFLVKRVFNNGYRCCCHSTVEGDDEWFDTETEALACVQQTKNFLLDTELEEVDVFDGSTGQRVAWARLEWVSYQRGQGYKHDRWYGETFEGPFENIRGNLPNESWEEMKTRLQKESWDEAIAKKQRELDALKSK